MIQTIVLVAAAAVLLITYRLFSFPRAVTKKSLRHIPELRFEKDDKEERYVSESRQLLAHGYDKYLRNGTPFQMRNTVGELGPQVFLPMKYLDEVKNAPRSIFSFEVFSEKMFLLDYSNGPRQTDAAVHATRVDLNRNLGSLATGIFNEAILALDAKAIPKNWTTLPAYETLCSVVTQVNAFALVGPSLCRNPEWIQLSMQAVITVIGTAMSIRATYSPRWRWLARWQSDAPKQVREIRAKATALLEPIYKERVDALKTKQDASTFRDAVNWLVRLKGGDKPLDKIVDNQLFLSIASVHTSSAVLTSILFDLFTHAESHDEILAEVREVLAECDGQWSMQQVAKMRKLDSFMKESFRLHPIGFITGQRIAVRSHTFKDGLHIPAGTVFQFPADAVHHDQSIYPDPHKFDAHRFLRLRETVDQNRFHFASVSDTSLGFGAGAHACPGRFLVTLSIKFILVALLTRYEVKLEDGNGKSPTRVSHDFNLRPSPEAKLLIRRL